VAKVERTGKTIAATLSDGSVVEGTELLIATDRKARTTGMTLNTVGGASDRAWIEVDDSMCTSSVSGGWLYAVGDPNSLAL
jgi:pyruvate/2-oxoglutarate dehydrogenase complex dihydrolipoamide dehydrogenase (E3) component